MNRINQNTFGTQTATNGHLSKRNECIVLRASVVPLVVVLLFGCSKPVVESSLRLLEIEAATLNLGELAESQVERILQVANPSGNAVSVDKFSGTCTCTSIQPSRFRIEPGGTQPVTVRLNLAGKSGPFSLRLEARAPDESLARIWTMEGKVIELFDEHLPTVDAKVSYPDRTFTFERRLKDSIRDIAAEVQPPLEAVESVVDDHLLQLKVTLGQSCPFGRSSTSIRLKGKTANHRDINILIPVTLERDRPYLLRPAVVNFGRLPIGTPAKSQLRIDFKAPCTALTVQSASDEIQATVGESPGPAGLEKIEVNFTIANPARGLFNGNVVLRATVDSYEFPITIPVSYLGEKSEQAH